MHSLKLARDRSSFSKLSLRIEGKAWRAGSRSDFQIPLGVFVASNKLRIDQEPEVVTSPVQYRFGKSEAVVAEETKGFCYGFLDSVSGEFCGLSGRERMEFNVYTLEVQDALGSQRTGNGIQASYFPVIWI